MSTGDYERDDEVEVDPDLDFDAAFAALVAQFDQPDVVLDRPVPVDTAPAPTPTAAPGPEEPPHPPELDEHFVPPEPPPLPRGDLYSRLAWFAVLGGPAFLLVAAFLGGNLPSILIVIAIAAFIGGFVTLVARMPGERSDDDGDGAVV
jgi:hypothetical protein